jgi:tryptophan synthase alpha chain
MNLIDKQISTIQNEGRIGLMTHLVIGYPTRAVTITLAKILQQSGSDFIELQIPFSDPLADGATIMSACEVALCNGMKVADSFAIAKKIKASVRIPLIFMAYFNTVLSYGVERFCHHAQLAGISGLIVPDLPPEEDYREGLHRNCRRYDLHLIRVVSPASTERRLQKNAELAQGFVYCTSRQGITGAQKTLDASLGKFLRRAHKIMKIPLAVGFGISHADHIKRVRDTAQIAVVGSAIIDIIQSSEQNKVVENVSAFVRSLRGREGKA